MATLADELLNDFEDSASEADGQDQNRFLEDDAQNAQEDALKNGLGGSTPSMELDGDEEENSDAEEELAAQNTTTDLKDAPDEEETKARVEKMKLGAVSDVRNVAGLMKTLQPILEVRPLPVLLFP
jgi:U4/U6 small nuclear ribonucleoprotein PRP31